MFYVMMGGIVNELVYIFVKWLIDFLLGDFCRVFFVELGLVSVEVVMKMVV